MAMSAGATFLNSFFAGFDKLFLSFYHSICCSPLTILFKIITFIGEKGVVFFAAALILMCFSKTRKTGVCLFGAVACGALITSIILKDLVARPRPFMFEPFSDWYLAVGAPFEDDFSFPSGHVTAAAAGMTALRLRNGKKWTIPGCADVHGQKLHDGALSVRCSFRRADRSCFRCDCILYYRAYFPHSSYEQKKALGRLYAELERAGCGGDPLKVWPDR